MKKNTFALPLLLLFVGAVIFLIVKPVRPPVGGSYSPPSSASAGQIAEKPAASSPEESDSPTAKPKEGVIYTPSETVSDDGALKPHTISLATGGSPATAAVNALLHAPESPLPPGTALRGIKIADGQATVDFSPEFRDNFHGGDTEASQAVNSLLKTLGQFPTIDRVQIWIGGKPADSLGGLLDISGPLDVIRSGDTQQARR